MDPAHRESILELADQVRRAEVDLALARERLIEQVVALCRTGYSQADIARALGITRATLNQRILRHERRKQGKQARARQAGAA